MKSPSFRVTNDWNSNRKDQRISSIFRSRPNVRRCIQDSLIVPTTVTLNNRLYHPRWKQLHSPIWIRVTGQRPIHSKHPQPPRTPNKTFILTRNKIDRSSHRVFSVALVLLLCTIDIFVHHLYFKFLSSRSLSRSVACSFSKILIFYFYVFVINSWSIADWERKKENSSACRTSSIGLKVLMTCQEKEDLIVRRFLQRVGERETQNWQAKDEILLLLLLFVFQSVVMCFLLAVCDTFTKR